MPPIVSSSPSLSLSVCRRFLLLGTLLLSLSSTSHATEHLLTLPGIGINAYDSDLVGFGIVAQDVDLAVIDPSLAGIKVTVTTSSNLPTSQARAWSSSVQPNPAVSRGPATWTFTFSQAIRGLWAAQNQTFNSGEVTSFTGAGSLTPSNLTGWQHGTTTTTTANAVQNLTPTSTTQNFSYGGGTSTSWSYTHNDTIGSFSGQAIQFRLSHAPEPARPLLLLLGTCLSLLHRRRPRPISLR